MRIASSGNVGIWSSTPSSVLALTDGSNGLIIGQSNENFHAANTHRFYNQNYSTEYMRVDSSGRVTMPYQPMFSANRAGLTYVNNINSNIDFIPIVNQGNHWNTSTHTFTCPVAGKYWVSVFNLNFTSVNSGASHIQINKNNGVVFTAYQDSPSGTDYHNSSASGILDCAANDTITFFSPSGVVYADQYCGATVYLIG